MAVVTTISAPVGKSINWTNPSNIGGNVSGIPLAKITFDAVFNVPLKGAADITEVAISCSLPRNFAYRVYTINLWVEANNNTAFTQYQQAMIGAIQTFNGPISKFFLRDQYTGGSQAPASGFQSFAQSGATGSTRNVAVYTPDNFNYLTSLLIDASDGSAAFNISWVDNTADATEDVIISFAIDFMQYSIDAINSWRVNMPQLITIN